MLTELRIRGIGVIEDATLEFSPGFTALTGETGAGKTMVVTGLTLLLGHRLDASKLAEGRASSVEGRLSLAPDGSLATDLEDIGAELDDDELLLSRRFTPQGRSRAAVGGAQVPVGVLGRIGGELMTLHGQSDQLRLRSPERQLAALDDSSPAEIEPVTAAYRSAYDAHRDVRDQLDRLSARVVDRERRMSRLRAVLDRLEAVAPRAGEIEELAAEENRLAHAETLRETAGGAAEAIASEQGGPDALNAVSAAIAALETAAGIDDAVRPLLERMRSAQLDLQDLGSELTSYAQDVDVSPGRLEQVQERRAEVTALLRDVGPTLEATTIPELLENSRAFARELLELEDSDNLLEALEKDVRRREADLAERALALTRARETAAESLAERVAAELGGLLMEGADFRIVVEPASPGPSGADRVAFELKPHPGAPFAPLSEGASGGELSRVMLALEVALATGRGAGEFPTFVFDEIDAGVGGRAAVAIGQRLAELARSAQVIVVTHLPQVAAYADQHLQVAKHTAGSHTASGVAVLHGEERVHELARMLAGSESETALDHARELLAAGELRHRSAS